MKFLEECSVFDPRFKSLSWLSEDKQAAVYSRVVELISHEIDQSRKMEEEATQLVAADPDVVITG